MQRDWESLAQRWLTNRPEDWVSDVAAFLEVEADQEGAEAERGLPLGVCDGCDGSVCDSEPHRHRRVLPVPTVVAKPVRGKGGRS